MTIPHACAAVVVAVVCGVGHVSPARAQVFELIDAFAGCPVGGCGADGDAAVPDRQLRLGPDGLFYGVSGVDWRADEEQPRSWGTIYRINTAGERVILRRFNNAGPGDCATGNLTLGADGAFYGIGGPCSFGLYNATIFRLTGTSFEIVEEFPAGFRPFSIAAGPGGTFYGFMATGGATLFLYKWDGTISNLGAYPLGGFPSPPELLQGPDGNLYFPSRLDTGESTRGAMLRITAGDRIESIGEFPANLAVSNNVILAGDGELYGTLSTYPVGFQSRLYRMSLAGALTDFGAGPFGSPLGAGADGSIILGRSIDPYGEIVRVTPAGELVPLHTFNGVDGSGQLPPLTEGPDGHLYGVASAGGAHGLGVFYRIRMPSAEVTANGGDGPITVAPGDPLEIAVAFDAAPTTTIDPSEIYVAVVTPALQVFWMTPGGFTTTPTRLYAGPLAAFGPVRLLTLPDAGVLPAGDYYWVTIVDSDANGVPNGTFVDFVKTTTISALGPRAPDAPP